MPVDPLTLAAFSLAAWAVVLSPGPDTMLILRYATGGGPGVGLATVAGVQAGLAVHTALAILGLSLVIAASPALFRAIAVAGALYVAWLGIQSMRAGGGAGPEGGPAAVPGRLKAARDAMITNLLNPKVILTFLALLPNFVEPERGAVPVQLAMLGAVLILVNMTWQVPLSLAAGAVRRRLANPKVQRAVNRGAGAVLMLFAAAMLVEHAW